MSRWRAAWIHLVVSLIVAAAVSIVMIGVMYPWEYFKASGGHRLLTILLSVDIIIGPLLTLLVFKTGKKNLKMDLTVIALLQVGALIYGMWNVVQARPVFLVHVGDRMYLVRANELSPDRLELGKEDRFRRLSWTGPTLAVALHPNDSARLGDLLSFALAGADFDQYPETYADYEEHSALVLETAKDTSALLKRRPTDSKAIADFLSTEDLNPDQTRVVPLRVGKNFLTALVDADDAKILKVFPVDPWE